MTIRDRAIADITRHKGRLVAGVKKSRDIGIHRGYHQDVNDEISKLRSTWEKAVQDLHSAGATPADIEAVTKAAQDAASVAPPFHSGPCIHPAGEE